MNTEIERHTTPTVPAREWGLMTQQAAALAESDIIPTAYRRKPANILVAALTGRSHGWDAMTSMNQGHVIEGKWAMRPEAMLGLVRRAGHSVSGDVAAEGATVTGKRADTGDTMAFTFTIADAVQANLCKLKDGKPFARSNSGKVLPWEQYPAMMCYWRAVGTVCRFLFSDVTLGAYSAEELGAELDADGNVVDAGRSCTPLPSRNRCRMRRRHGSCRRARTTTSTTTKCWCGRSPRAPLIRCWIRICLRCVTCSRRWSSRPPKLTSWKPRSSTMATS